MEISPEYRSNIEKEILMVLGRALEEDRLTEEDSSGVAGYILDHLDGIQTHPQLIQFIESLAKRWPVFSEIGNIEMAKIIQSKKIGVAASVENFLHQGNIQGALDVAKTLQAN